MSEQFGLLYATPSFLEGLARAIDIGDTLTEYNTSENGAEADARALASDWKAVGNDMRPAIAQYRKEMHRESSKG